jgi:hypothetical protein
MTCMSYSCRIVLSIQIVLTAAKSCNDRSGNNEHNKWIVEQQQDENGSVAITYYVYTQRVRFTLRTENDTILTLFKYRRANVQNANMTTNNQHVSLIAPN